MPILSFLSSDRPPSRGGVDVNGGVRRSRRRRDAAARKPVQPAPVRRDGGELTTHCLLLSGPSSSWNGPRPELPAPSAAVPVDQEATVRSLGDHAADGKSGRGCSRRSRRASSADAQLDHLCRALVRTRIRNGADQMQTVHLVSFRGGGRAAPRSEAPVRRGAAKAGRVADRRASRPARDGKPFAQSAPRANSDTSCGVARVEADDIEHARVLGVGDGEARPPSFRRR